MAAWTEDAVGISGVPDAGGINGVLDAAVFSKLVSARSSRFLEVGVVDNPGQLL